MGRILYVFPHPDDESFGPAPVLSKQQRAGHEVYLLTLTRGEATRQREKHGYSKEEMGAVRYEEMQCVARTLQLAGLTVLDFADGELERLDPRVLEEAVAAHVEEVRPEVLVTYPVNGVSGHPDHLVAHAVVKRLYCALRDGGADYLRRLAFFALTPESRDRRPGHLQDVPEETVGCVVRFGPEDRARAEAALDCYRTYQDTIAEHRPLDTVAAGVAFQLFQETHDPPLDDLFAGGANT